MLLPLMLKNQYGFEMPIQWLGGLDWAATWEAIRL